MDEKGKALKGSKKKFSIQGQFGWRLIEMYEAPAFRVLSKSGHLVLARLEVELGNHAGNDNGKLPTTFDQFEAYGIHRHSIAPAIREVVALGFVEITEAGRAGNAAWRRPSKFRLTYRPTKNAEPTDDWKKIDTMEQAEAVGAAARKTENQCRKPHHRSVRKPHHNPDFCSAETDTTACSAETTTTSISWEDRAEGDTARQPAPKSGQATGATRRAAVRDLLATSLRSVPLDTLGDEAFPAKRRAQM